MTDRNVTTIGTTMSRTVDGTVLDPKTVDYVGQELGRMLHRANRGIDERQQMLQTLREETRRLELELAEIVEVRAQTAEAILAHDTRRKEQAARDES